MHLLIDLDGTLTDSRQGIINCLQHALAENGLPVPEAKDLLWCIGPPLLETLKKLVGPDSLDRFDPVVKSYRERYSVAGVYENSVYPDVENALVELRELGHTLHVATSKAEVFAKQIIAHFSLNQYFVSVSGSDLDGTRANKADLIAHILDREKIAKPDVVMIGDREHDIIGAKKNGIPAIGVLWGYGTGAELMGAGAKACVRVPQLLAASLRAIQ